MSATADRTTVDSPILSVRDLSVSINGTLILKSVSFDLRDREIFAIIGTSGCGKSILLKSIVGLVQEEYKKTVLTGQILYHNFDVINLNGREKELFRRKVVYLPQNPTVFNMSVYENISTIIAYWRKRDPSAFEYYDRNESEKELVYKYLCQASLWEDVKDKLDLNASYLSTGQRQRLCLARALAVEPQILLLDEPAAHLDHIAMQKLEESMDELRESLAIMIVTHNMQQAARTSQRTAQMILGDMIEVGDTEQIFTNPQHRITEDYITGRFG